MTEAKLVEIYLANYRLARKQGDSVEAAVMLAQARVRDVLAEEKLRQVPRSERRDRTRDSDLL